MSAARKNAGFTLVEILIVVIILGILAAIVIPQFTDASTSAKNNSLTSQVQTIRSQLELYKSAHASTATGKLFATAAAQWQELTNKTDTDGTVNTASGAFGPYLQNVPVNNLNGKSGVVIMTVVTDTTATVAAGSGWVYDSTSGKFWATNLAGTGLITN